MQMVLVSLLGVAHKGYLKQLGFSHIFIPGFVLCRVYCNHIYPSCTSAALESLYSYTTC